MQVRFFTQEQYHGKRDIGSTRLRVHNLIKYWPEAGLYKYGENPDVMIYQKVYLQPDWDFMKYFEGLQILDICDPDWLDHQDIRATIDLMDGVTCPTKNIADFIRQFSDVPVKVIPDRHDVVEFPPPKKHTQPLKSAVWFGYSQNAEVLKQAITSLEKRGIELTVISNNNPYLPWGNDYVPYLKYDQDTIYQDLQKYDVVVLPRGNRPKDRFKSNNKTTMSQLLGLPVVSDADELEAMLTPEARQADVDKWYDVIKDAYDVKRSVSEMKDFIDELQNS